MKIRKSTDLDKTDILKIHTLAFGEKKGPEIARLVNGLFEDETAWPSLSLVAIENKKVIGHILFTRAIVTGSTLSTQLLGPLAILPDFQNTGIGDRLIKEGLTQLKTLDVALVFVLGHPDYYPRTGFKPAGVLGFQAPYPIPEKHAGAWMVQELFPSTIKDVSGKIQCCDVFNQPEHWRE
ncbi:MAG: N-acetyltransferase [Desulfobacula sp.]|uniref:GNAT family N-acetyltransferase n=2 Tax=Desulfobacula sp. TaxID=2593537 RepID=UPI001D76BA2C|nr:N-acetyltransferase [Desulfobacula sp.]MBT3486079.1 N-acetyltransferase [Desulfobacula sp.]MBT3804463.1 N-acetyltransferase [Desulfobacula sp.]MBT4024943.1 N-acetyltransferase [Desulfobacula sp.]MBT4198825.1 N-acetyltransferase [Desulfobacula sp.]